MSEAEEKAKCEEKVDAIIDSIMDELKFANNNIAK